MSAFGVIVTLFHLKSYLSLTEGISLVDQRSYKVNGNFEERSNEAIYDTLNGHRLFNIYQMIIDFCFKVEY